MKKIISVALLFVGLLMELTHVDGNEYNSPNLMQVQIFEKEAAEFCVRPLSQNPNDVLLALRLEVKSTVHPYNIRSAGNSSITDFTTNRWHKVTTYHTIENSVHILDVKVDGRAIPFKKPDKTYFWKTSYKFKEITLLSKGRVEITDCTPELEATIAATTRTTTTTTAKTTTTTTTATTARISTTLPTITTIATKLSTKAMDTLTEAMRTITDAKTTVEVSQPENDIQEAGTPWWDFIHCMGDFKGFPVLGMVVIALILGVVIAALSTIICKRCCCSRKPERVINSNRGSLGKDYIHRETNLQDALLPPTSHQTSNHLHSSNPNYDYYHQERTLQDDFLPPPYYASRNDMHLENLHGENIRFESNPTSTLKYNATQYASLHTAPPDLTPVYYS